MMQPLLNSTFLPTSAVRCDDDDDDDEEDDDDDDDDDYDDDDDDKKDGEDEKENKNGLHIANNYIQNKYRNI